MHRRNKKPVTKESEPDEVPSEGSPKIVVATTDSRPLAQTQTQPRDQDLQSGRRYSERLRHRDDANRQASAQNLPSRSREQARNLRPEEAAAISPPDPPLIRRGVFTSVEEARSELIAADTVLAERRELELERMSTNRKKREKERERVRLDEEHNVWDEDTLFGFWGRCELSQEPSKQAGAPAQAPQTARGPIEEVVAGVEVTAEERRAAEKRAAKEDLGQAQEAFGGSEDGVPEQVDDDETGDYDLDEDLYS